MSTQQTVSSVPRPVDIPHLVPEAQTLSQPEVETVGGPLMTHAMTELIHSIMCAQLQDSTWPRLLEVTTSAMGHEVACKHSAGELLATLPVRHYMTQLRSNGPMTDGELEVLRLFCLLVYEIREATGLDAADEEVLIDNYVGRTRVPALDMPLAACA